MFDRNFSWNKSQEKKPALKNYVNLNWRFTEKKRNLLFMHKKADLYHIAPLNWAFVLFALLQIPLKADKPK